MGTPNQRFDWLINRLFNSKTEAAQALGWGRAYISNLTTGNKPLNGEVYQRISDCIPIVNIDWLIHGRGPMLFQTYMQPAEDDALWTGVQEEDIQLYYKSMPSGAVEAAPALNTDANAREVSTDELERMVHRLGYRVQELEDWQRDMEEWRKEAISVLLSKNN